MMVPENAPQLYAVQQPTGQDNIWNDASMGTDSIFMHSLSSKDVEQSRQARAHQPNPYAPARGQSAEDAWRSSSPFTGTNSVFFGSNGGGNGWAAKPQSLYGGGWSAHGHEHRAQDPKHIPSVPQLGGTNFVFEGADGYHYGWARQNKGHAAAGKVLGAKKSPAATSAIRATQQAAGGWTTAGHEHRPQDPLHIPSVPHLGGTNYAFEGADGGHYGWAKKAPPAGRVNKDVEVKPVHKAHPKLGWNY